MTTLYLVEPDAAAAWRPFSDCRPVAELRAGSEILADLIANHGLQVVGAEYSLESGIVTFLDSDS